MLECRLKIKVKPFELDATPVTDAVSDFRTEAQDYGWSFVLSSLVLAEVKANKEVQSLARSQDAKA